MSRKIKKIIDDLDQENNIIKYFETKDVMEDVEKFLIKKKLMLYGGYALNLLLPVKYKFYNKYTINDFDCYSKNAKEDAYELANILNKKGYEYIQVKQAFHENTYRVYVNFTQVLDITHIEEELHDKLFEITLRERKMKKTFYKYYKKYKLYIVPIILLKRNLHYELARPKGSYYRWVKIFERISLVNKFIKFNKSKKKSKFVKIPEKLKKINNIIKDYIKKNNYPLVGSYALKLLNNNIKTDNCCRLHDAGNQYTILSIDYEKTTEELVNLIKKNIDLKKYEVYTLKRELLLDILYKRYRILVKNKENENTITFVNVLNLKDDCLSIKKVKGFTIGSIDTILYYHYSLYIIYYIYSEYNNDKNKTTVEDTIRYINEFELILKKITIENRLSKICYGNHIPRTEIIKNQWKKKPDVYYPNNN